MTDYTPSPAFHDAAAYLSRASASSNVSNDVKLEVEHALLDYISMPDERLLSQPSDSFMAYSNF